MAGPHQAGPRKQYPSPCAKRLTLEWSAEPGTDPNRRRPDERPGDDVRLGRQIVPAKGQADTEAANRDQQDRQEEATEAELGGAHAADNSRTTAHSLF